MELLVKLIQKFTVIQSMTTGVAIQPMALIRATLIASRRLSQTATAQIKTDYEAALHKLLITNAISSPPKLSTTNTSSPDAPYVPISLAQHKHHKETRLHKLAIECRLQSGAGRNQQGCQG